MIEQLLSLVAEGGVHSYEELMRRLGISQPLLEMMLENLARLGYLRSVNDGCGTQCAGCAMGGCSVAGSGQLWALTGKGAQAARRLAQPPQALD
jgi:FeoC like transcriptional regulator